MTPIQRFREIKLKNIVSSSENFQSQFQNVSVNKRNQDDILKTSNEQLSRKDSIKIIIDAQTDSDEILKAEYNQF